MEKKGEMTVFLSLILTILISVFFTVIETARSNAIQFQTECVTDMALQSALAEYNRELLEQYDLFFIDIGYGTKEEEPALLEKHIRDYMESNFHMENQIPGMKIRDLLEMQVHSVNVLEMTGAAYNSGEVLERAAVDYMKDKYGIINMSFLKDAVDTVKNNGLLGDSLEKRRKENENAIKSIKKTIKNDDGSKKKIKINNPADKVNAKRGTGEILTILTKERGLSEKEADLNAYLSHREYRERNGFLLKENAISTMEDMLFQKYLMEKCGNYVERKKGSYLDYQMEYILSGKYSDKENLQNVVNKILIIREIANFMYLWSDSEKQEEAEILAMTLSVIALIPELKDLIKVSIMLAWAYAESVCDGKTLLEGGKIPIWKERSSWQLSLENAMNFKMESTNKENGGAGLSYQEYLHLLLAFTNKTDRNLRFMDIVEMDIRQSTDNENFRMDCCISDFTAEITVSSVRGHNYFITRTVGYQK